MKNFSYSAAGLIVCVLSFFCNHSVIHVQASAAPVAHWGVDEGSGTTAVDSSGNNNTGTLINGPVWTTGQISGALDFDGTNDYVEVADDSSLVVTSDLTVSAWIYPRSLGDNNQGRIVDKASHDGTIGYVFRLNSSNRIGLQQSGVVAGVNSSNGAVGLNAWTHVVGVVQSGTTVTLYANGVNVGGGTLTSPIGANTKTLRIGLRHDGKRAFDGIIDDVRIYDQALTASEADAIYQQGIGTPQPPTVTLSASPTTITSGGSSTLSWSSTAATNCTATDGWSGTKGSSGLEDVFPTVDTTYTLTCTNSMASASDSATVTVTTLSSTGNPVAHWTVDEGSGTTAEDNSGNDNTGTLINGPVWTTGQISGALDFDGTNNYVEVADDGSLDVTSDLTVSAWIYPRSLGDNNQGRIVDKASHDGTIGYVFRVNSSNGIGLQQSGVVAGVNSSNGAIGLNAWTHVVGVVESGTAVTLYANGVNVGGGTLTSPIGANTKTLRIGMRHDGRRAFDGIIDDVRIYDQALTASEADALYQQGLNMFSVNDIVQTYFPLPESAGGWRSLVSINVTPTPTQKADIIAKAGIDWDALEAAWNYSESLSSGTTVLVIRNGWVAGEWGSTSSYNVASVTKSLTGLAMVKVMDLSDRGQLPQPIGFESPAYLFLPQTFDDSDPLKRQIKVKHLMTMSPGIKPADPDLLTMSERLMYPMEAAPETEWVYSSLPPNLLSMIIQDAVGQSFGDFFNSEIATAIGASPLGWETIDGGFTKGAAGASVNARDLARIAYLILQDGTWDNSTGLKQIVSVDRVLTITEWAPFLESTTFRDSPGSPFEVPSDSPNHYGYLWWTNRTQVALGPAVPVHAYYMHGFRDNLAVIVPSENLIVIRLARSGPGTEPTFRSQFMSLVMDSLVN